MYRCRPKDLGDLSDDEQKALAATVGHAWELLLSLLKNPKSDGALEVKTEERPDASGFDPQRDLFQEHGERIREIVAASLVCPIDPVRVALCDGMRNFCSGFITPVNKVSTGTRLRDENMMSSLFLQEFLRLLPYTASKTRRCAEYFQLVAELFTASFEHGRFDFAQFSLPSIEQMPDGQDPKQLNILEQLESLLQCHDPGEAHSDQTLLGLLNLIKVVVQLMATSAGAKGSRELLDRSAPRLIEEIYQCLYASGVDLTKRDKCVSVRCRDAALKTLSELSASGSKAFSTQLELTRDAHLNMPAHEVSLLFFIHCLSIISPVRILRRSPAARVGPDAGGDGAAALCRASQPWLHLLHEQPPTADVHDSRLRRGNLERCACIQMCTLLPYPAISLCASPSRHQKRLCLNPHHIAFYSSSRGRSEPH
jgi:hypothetical protein